jgi:dihydroneopterin aldolase
MSSGEPPPPVRIEVHGLSIYTHHGVSEAEREIGQRLVIDVVLEPVEVPAVTSDELVGTVDYGEIAAIAATEATAASRRTLERVAGDIAAALSVRFSPRRVTVRATKPEPPLELRVEATSVEVTLTPGADA